MLKTTLVRYIYSAFFYLAIPFVLLRLLWKSRRSPVYRTRILERFGYSKLTFEKSILVHAVSLGESIIAISIIKQLRLRYPTTPIVVTTMTPTGAARIQTALGDSVSHVFVPYDLPDAIQRFFNRIHPTLVIVVETELWPNLFAACRKRKIPLVIANGRLAERSFQGYQRIAAITREMLQSVTLLMAQGRADADRFITLGMNARRVVVTGNIKFDLELPVDLIPRSEVLRMHLGKTRPIWIAASTHTGEEEIVLNAHALIREQYPNALLIIAPRHPERFTAVAELIVSSGLSLTRRSSSPLPTITSPLPLAGEGQGEGTAVVPNPAIYLADTMGEMFFLYATADVAFVAGSFAPIGGHNLLEPAALSKPVITGPHLFNFTDISELLDQAEALVKVSDAVSLANAVIQFFANPALQKQKGENGRLVVESNRGALAKHVDLIAEIQR